MDYARIQQKQRHQEAKEEEKQRHQEVDWGAYFDSIVKVCPWSKKYYMQDKILHVKVGTPGTELSFGVIQMRKKTTRPHHV